MIDFTHSDFTKLIDLLSTLEDFRAENSRWRLIDDILTGVPRERSIRGQIDLSGKPRPAAVSLVTTFLRFGEVERGTELISVLLNRLIDGYVFDQNELAFLRGLFDRYPLDIAVSGQGTLTNWKGLDNPEYTFEKIIGENTLKDIMLLELALEAARSVVRIRTRNSLASGFLCGKDIVMTNFHVIPDMIAAQNSEFAFFYELGRDLLQKPSQIVKAKSGGYFFCDQVLDVALVELNDVPIGVNPLSLTRQGVKREERVSIIQHPGGHFKKISMQNNFVEYSDNSIVQYTTSTEPGSSGSPVFNGDFEVVAVHHSGGMLVEPSTGRRYLRNAGSALIAVLQAVQAHSPELYARLNVK